LNLKIGLPPVLKARSSGKCLKILIRLFFKRQSILIAILVKFNLISVSQWPYFPTIVDTVNGLQDFLICIEMFLAAIAHIIAFPITPYKLDETLNWWSNIANAANVSDFNSEVSQHYNHFYTKVKSYVSKRRKRNTNQDTSAVPSNGSEEDPPSESSRLLTSDNENDYYGPTYEIVSSSANYSNEITEII